MTGARGRLVPDLTRDDFAVDDNGKRQTLTLFSNDIQPITLIMLLDRSGSLKPNFDLEERAAEALVRAMLPADKARIGSFAKNIQIVPEAFTSDRDALIRILRTELQEDGPTPAVERGRPRHRQAARRARTPGHPGLHRRVAMPLQFSGKSTSLKDVIKRAEEQDVMVYAIGLAGDTGMPVPTGRDDRGRGGMNPGAFGGLGGSGLGGNTGQAMLQGPDEGLPKIAAATGGGYFELTSPRDLASTFARVADELHHQYALGFTPETLDGKMHDLTIHLSNPNLVARARKRYLAAKAPATP